MKNILPNNQEKISKPSNPVGSEVNSVSQGKGAPVIMVHGLAASLHDWDTLLPELAAAGFCWPRTRFARSRRELQTTKSRSITPATRSLHTCLAGLIRSTLMSLPSLIGHSLGGYLSLQYTLQYPERVRALVLVNPFYTQSQLPPMLRFFLRRPLLNNTIIEHTPYWLFRLMIDVTSLQFGGQQRKIPYVTGKCAYPDSPGLQTGRSRNLQYPPHASRPGP